jgi:predicted NBD/HSP70 family sugar kinase
MYHLCIDIGGTKTSISVATSEGQFLEKTKFSTLKGNDVGKCVETILLLKGLLFLL